MLKEHLFLAIIQGLTEFLPISSSAHLVILNKILGGKVDLLFYTILHLGTVFSLIVFFFKDIINVLKDLELLKKIFVVNILSGGIGFAGIKFFEGFFSSFTLVIVALFINGLILIFTDKRYAVKKKKPDFGDSLILGVSQTIAIIPGISRSGITISTLLLRGLDREEAFRFSFLASVPLIVGAFIWETKEEFGLMMPFTGILKYKEALFLSFMVGYLSLLLLRFLVKKTRLDLFGYYCIVSSLFWYLYLFRMS